MTVTDIAILGVAAATFIAMRPTLMAVFVLVGLLAVWIERFRERAEDGAS